jgi:hypothetical protein
LAEAALAEPKCFPLQKNAPPHPTQKRGPTYSCCFSPAHFMRICSGSRAAILPPSKPCIQPLPLPGPPLLYLQPLSLLFPTLRRSALPGENTAVSERSCGPDWHCGTLLGHSHGLGEVTAPSQRQRAMALGSQTFNYQNRFWLAVTGNRRCVEFFGGRLGLSIWWWHLKHSRASKCLAC